MGNYAIVGGAGFIGSHFVDELAMRNNNILVIDNYCSGSQERVENHLGRPYFQIANIDAEDTASLSEAFKNVETVIHLASNPDIAKAAVDPRIDFTQGTSLTESVMEASRIARVKKVLYASGSGVYKANGLDPIPENSQLQPISTYGASKLAGEALLSSYNFMFGIKSIAFRFANVVGPKQTHGVGYDFMRKLKNNKESLVVLGDGSQTKSYIHVTDVVSAVLLAEKKIGSEFDVFNVSTPDYISVAEIAELAIFVSGLDRDKINIEFGSSDRGWKADVPKIFLDSTKIRSLGWESKMNSREAIQSSLISLTE
jgi:UDP-glucose 4-epimerase